MWQGDRGLAAALFAALCCQCGEDPRPPEATPRNVIFIVIDALRADHVGALGYERATTPRLDALAEKSVLFTRTYSAASWTLPSVASLMTSLYPSVHGLRQPPTAEVQFALADRLLTLAESLAGHGFETASITSQPWISERTGLTQGFGLVRTVAHASLPGEPRLLAAELIEWLAQPRRQPFFLYAHFMGPHAPYDVPSELTGRYTAGRAVPAAVAEFHRLYEFDSEEEAHHSIVERAARGGLTDEDVRYLTDEYDEKLASTDACLGRLFEALEAGGLLDESVLVVTADHGEAFNEHGTIFHGEHLHEELVRVPLILHLPGDRESGRRIDDLVELIDLYPTLHELLGLPIPPNLQGESLLPLFRGGRSDGLAFAEGTDFKLVTRDWSAFYPYSDALHVSAGLHLAELYHLAVDPLEQTNVAATEPATAEWLRELAFELWQEMFDMQLRHRVVPDAADLTGEAEERLRALGYLGPGS